MKTSEIFLYMIRFYQRHLSLNSRWAKSLFLTDKSCRFSPTCSEYTYQAIKKYGTIKGVFLGLRRIIKCNPFNKGGFDPLR